MIPLRDHNPSSTTPFITYGLILVNVLVFGWMFFLPERAMDQFIQSFSLIPVHIVAGKDLYTLVTAMFLHGGFGHIIGNMLFLNIFGDNLEDRLGHFSYLVFYLLCGLAASYAQIYVDPTSSIPNLGASGAIAGLLGGYLLLFPRNRVDVLLPFGLYMNTISLPAYTMLIYWFFAQLLTGVGSLGVNSGIAYFAHIGGFVAGVVLVKIFELRRSLF